MDSMRRAALKRLRGQDPVARSARDCPYYSYFFFFSVQGCSWLPPRVAMRDRPLTLGKRSEKLSIWKSLANAVDARDMVSLEIQALGEGLSTQANCETG